MVNILEAQQYANKELLNEIETLKKQLANKEQQIQQAEEDLKFRIWKTIHRIEESHESSTHLMLLAKFTWPEKGWVSSKSGKFDSLSRYLDWDEEVFKKYAVFSKDFNLENVIKSFDQELKSEEDSFRISFEGYQFLENQSKEKIADLEKEIEENKERIKELTERIESLEEAVLIEQEEAKKALEKAKEWRERQLTDLTGLKQDELVKNLEVKREELFMEMKKKDEELKIVSVDLEDVLYENKIQKVEIKKLRQELAEKSKDLEDIKWENGEQRAEISKQKIEISQLKGQLYYLVDKPLPERPLPSLPKKELNKFQKLGAKIKTTFKS